MRGAPAPPAQRAERAPPAARAAAAPSLAGYGYGSYGYDPYSAAAAASYQSELSSRPALCRRALQTDAPLQRPAPRFLRGPPAARLAQSRARPGVPDALPPATHMRPLAREPELTLGCAAARLCFCRRVRLLWGLRLLWVWGRWGRWSGRQQRPSQRSAQPRGAGRCGRQGG